MKWTINSVNRLHKLDRIRENKSSREERGYETTVLNKMKGQNSEIKLRLKILRKTFKYAVCCIFLKLSDDLKRLRLLKYTEAPRYRRTMYTSVIAITKN